jgi:hypothetical protein
VDQLAKHPIHFVLCLLLQMDKLSGMFQQQTGQSFGGSSVQSSMMAKFISSKLGFDVPPQMLEKL